MAARKARPAVVVIHPSTRLIPPRLFDAEMPAQLHLLQLVPDRPRPVHRLPPVFESPTGVGDPEVLDDVDQPILTFGERLWQGSRLVEQNPSLIGGDTTCGPGPEGGSGPTGIHGNERRADGPDQRPSDSGA